MRSKERLDSFYKEVKRIHMEHFQDWRFGQLMTNFFEWIYTTKKTDPFFPEESTMIKMFKEFAGETQ